MFEFKETIKAKTNYKVYTTKYLLEKTKDDSSNAMFHDLVLLNTSDFTDLILMDGGTFVMAAESKSFSEFKNEVLEGNNEAAKLEEMFITRKGNKYIYWRDIITGEDFLTKIEEDQKLWGYGIIN